MSKGFFALLITVTIILPAIEGCGDSASEPTESTEPEFHVEFDEVFTDINGEGNFTINGSKHYFKTIDETTGEPVKNVESYLATDGKNAVILLIDPFGDYIPRLASDETNISFLPYSQLAPYSSQDVWTGTKEIALRMWSEYVKEGCNLAYEDRLPFDLTWEMLRKHYESWRTTTLEELESALSDAINKTKGTDIAIVELLFGPSSDGRYLKTTVIEDTTNLSLQTLCLDCCDKYLAAGYGSDQKLEIWRMKVTDLRFGSPLSVIPRDPPGSNPVDDTPPETFIVDAPDESIDYNDVTFTWEGEDDQSEIPELLYCYYLENRYASEWSSWSPWSSKTSVTYNVLDQGDYAFYVKSRDKSNNIDPTPATKEFIVTEPPSEFPQIEIYMAGSVFNVGDTLRVFYKSKRGVEDNTVNVYVLFESLYSGRQFYFYEDRSDRAPAWLAERLAKMESSKIEVKSTPEMMAKLAPADKPIENWLHESSPGCFMKNWRVENASGHLFDYTILSDFPRGDYRLYTWLTIPDADYNEVLGDESLTTFEIISPADPCFIATAAYGDPLAEDIQVLRAFRDKRLLTNWLGRRFVGLYYRLSPPIADYIRQHEFLRRATRISLKPVILAAQFSLRATLLQSILITLGFLLMFGLALGFRHKLRTKTSKFCSVCMILILPIILAGIICIFIGCGDSEDVQTPTPDELPDVQITSPVDGSIFSEGESIDFVGLGVDSEDGILSDSSLVWRSDIDGNIGTGNAFRNSSFSIGVHEIELSGADSQGQEQTDQVTIEIVEVPVGEVLTSLPAPGNCPAGLTWDTKNLWIADNCDRRIYKIDCCSGLVVGSFASPGAEPSGLAWDGAYLWNVDSSEDMIYKISIPDFTIVESFSAPAGNSIALTWDGENLWTADTKEKRIYRISPEDGLVIESFSSPGDYPCGLAWDGDYLWTADVWYHKIFMLDPSNGSVIMSFPAPGTWPRDMTWDGKYLCLADSTEKKIHRMKTPEKPEEPEELGEQ